MTKRIFKSDEFREKLPELMSTGQHAIFRGLPLLDGETSVPIGNFRKRFGHLEIPVHEDYGYLMNQYHDSITGGHSLWSTVRALIDGECDQWFSSQNAVCSSKRLPSAIERRLEPLPGLKALDSEPVLKMFYAKEGTRTLLHFDQDHRHVLLRQVCGRKRVVMIEPSQHEHLLPIGHNSTLNFSLLNDDERDRLFHSFSAEIAILEPGDLLYMPPLIWHYIEYVSTGLSIGHRFARNPINKFFSEDLHQTGRLQNIAVRYLDGKTVSEEEMASFAELQNMFNRNYSTGYEKYFALDSLIDEIYRRMFSPPRFLAIGIRDLEQKGFLQLVKMGKLYSN